MKIIYALGKMDVIEYCQHSSWLNLLIEEINKMTNKIVAN